MKSAKQPTAPTTATYQIWEACDEADGAIAGYLITAGDSLDRPVGYCANRSGRDDARRAFRQARAAVQLLQDTGEHAGAAIAVLMRDLRTFGRTESARPMPGFVYGLRCRRVDELAEPLDGDRPRSPRPFCRFLLTELVDRHNRLQWSEKERRVMPRAMIGIRDPGEGTALSIELDPPAEAG